MDQLLIDIQLEMDQERANYELISQQLQDLDVKRIPVTPANAAALGERDRMSTELIKSQLRFANLCEKNAKLMRLQNPTLRFESPANSDSSEATTDGGKRARKSLSALHREKKKEQPTTGDTVSNADDTEMANRALNDDRITTDIQQKSADSVVDIPQLERPTTLPSSIVLERLSQLSSPRSVSPSLSPMSVSPRSSSPVVQIETKPQKAFDRQADYDKRKRILDQIRKRRQSPSPSPQPSPRVDDKDPGADYQLSPGATATSDNGGQQWSPKHNGKEEEDIRADVASGPPKRSAVTSRGGDDTSTLRTTPLKSILKSPTAAAKGDAAHASTPQQHRSSAVLVLRQPTDENTAGADKQRGRGEKGSHTNGGAPRKTGKEGENDKERASVTDEQQRRQSTSTSDERAYTANNSVPPALLVHYPPATTTTTTQKPSVGKPPTEACLITTTAVDQKSVTPTAEPARHSSRSPFNNTAASLITAPTRTTANSNVPVKSYRSTYSIPAPKIVDADEPTAFVKPTSKITPAETRKPFQPLQDPVGVTPVTALTNGQKEAPSGGQIDKQEPVVLPVEAVAMPAISTSSDYDQPQKEQRRTMPLQNDSVPSASSHHDETTVVRDWDPTPLLDTLYKIDYSPKKESKRNRFVNMEGHLDHLPLGVKTAYVEKQWQEHYFRTHEGRLQWFNVPYAEDHPFGDVLLAGTEVDCNKEELTLNIHGGRDHARLMLRCPPPHAHLFDKWRAALQSHSASSVVDSYVLPLYPPTPHYTQKVAIIELGSCSIRGGLLTVEPSLPQSFFPTIATVCDNGELVVGAEALQPSVRHLGRLSHPVQSTEPGREKYNVDLRVVRSLFDRVFYDLHVQPDEYKVLLSVPQNVPNSAVGGLLNVLLNEVGAKAVAVTRHPSLVLYAYDVTTGVVVDIGHRLNIVPVVDGYVVENAIVSLPYGSQQIADQLRSKLCDMNMGVYGFMSPVERYILRYIMEQTCFVAPENFDEEVKHYQANPNDVDVKVDLDEFNPTNEMIKTFNLDSCRFTSTEGLFKPKKWGLDIEGIHKLVHQAVQKSPMDSRRALYRNIYLAGGATLLPGLAERLENELGQLVASTIHIQVHISPWRYHAAYLGAQVIASSAQFDQTLITAPQLAAFLQKLSQNTF